MLFDRLPTEDLKWSRDDWQRVLWSDEVTFETGKKAKDMVLRSKGQSYCQDCCQHKFRSGRISVLVWGAIGTGFKTDLVFLEGLGTRGGLTRDDYIEQVLGATVEPQTDGMRLMWDCPLLPQDRANST